MRQTLTTSLLTLALLGVGAFTNAPADAQTTPTRAEIEALMMGGCQGVNLPLDECDRLITQFRAMDSSDSEPLFTTAETPAPFASQATPRKPFQTAADTVTNANNDTPYLLYVGSLLVLVVVLAALLNGGVTLAKTGLQKLLP